MVSRSSYGPIYVVPYRIVALLQNFVVAMVYAADAKTVVVDEKLQRWIAEMVPAVLYQLDKPACQAVRVSLYLFYSGAFVAVAAAVAAGSPLAALKE